MTRDAKALSGDRRILVEILEAVPQGVIAVDGEGRVVDINENACRMFGYARDALVGKELGVLLPESFRQRHVAHLAGFFQKPARRMMGYGTGELWGRRADGAAFPVDVGLSSLLLDRAPLALAFVSDVSERRSGQEELRQSREKLQQLARQLTSVSEEESRKWARELHDVYSQHLVGIAMELARVASKSDRPAEVRSVEEKVRVLAEDIHNLSRSMHPNILHDLGLAAALKAELDAFQRDHGVDTEFLREDVPGDLPPEVALCFYRVAQESLRNIRKHSGASRVATTLKGTADGLAMTIEDFGDGFELDRVLRQGGLGLISMEERVLAVGGEFSVDSLPGRGTTVRVTVPLSHRKATDASAG